MQVLPGAALPDATIGVELIEHDVRSKHEADLASFLGATLCEDVVALTADFVVLADGATDKHGQRYLHTLPDGATEEISGGLLVARSVAAAVDDLDAELDAHAAFAEITGRVAHDLEACLASGQDLPPRGLRPAASVCIYSVARRELWRVGDTPFRIDDETNVGEKLVDDLASHVRALVTEAELAGGRSLDELAIHDPGRAAIMPILTCQGLLANTEGFYGYGVVDGTEIPERFIEVFDVPAGAEVVMASDGHIDLSGDLAHAEAVLAAALTTDPLCIGILRGTKGLAPGAASFDDRAWLRFRTQPA